MVSFSHTTTGQSAENAHSRIVLQSADYFVQVFLLLGFAEQVIWLGEQDVATTYICTFAIVFYLIREWLTLRRAWFGLTLSILLLFQSFDHLWWISHFALFLLLPHISGGSFLVRLTALILSWFGVFADWARDDFFRLAGEVPLGLRYWHIVAILLLLLFLWQRLRWLGVLLFLFIAMIGVGLPQHGVSLSGASYVTPLLLIFLGNGVCNDRRILYFGLPLVAVAIFGLGALEGNSNRCKFQLDTPSIPKHFIKYLLIAEDPRFFWHSGVDLHRLRMAAQETMNTGVFGRGGSTLSMQTAKVCFLSYEKTISRKVLQTLMGWVLELAWSKQEVVGIYLNNVSFGPGALGITQAAQHYFGVTPGELSREQSLALVLTIFNPTTYNPGIIAPPEARMRRAVVQGRFENYQPLLDPEIQSLGFILAESSNATKSRKN